MQFEPITRELIEKSEPTIVGKPGIAMCRPILRKNVRVK